MSKIDGSHYDAYVLIYSIEALLPYSNFSCCLPVEKHFTSGSSGFIFYHCHQAFMITPVDTVLNQAGSFRAFPVEAFWQYHVPAVQQ